MQLSSDLLARYAYELSDEDLDDKTVKAAKRLTLDSLGCCLGAYDSPPIRSLRRLYGDVGSGATVLGDGTDTRVEYAGLINAAMVRYLDYNDTYISQGRACHPSDHIPALLSVAEHEGATGADLVRAIVLAYEIEGLGLDTGVTWEHRYDYVTWGAFSSAAAVGTLMGLSQEEIQHAIGIAGASNITLGISRRGNVNMWKGMAHSYVTHNAIQACQMAGEGITGPEAVFEGSGGFFDVVAGRDLRVEQLAEENATTFRVTDAHIKPYPCGYYMQPMIAGVRELVSKYELDSSELEAIEIETFEQAAHILAGEEKWSKQLTRESADHSIPYTASIAVLHGDVVPKHYDEAYRTDPAVHELMDLVTVKESDELDAFAAEHADATPTVVRLITNGETVETRIDHAPGHARNPMTQAEIEAKMRPMAAAWLPDTQIDSLVESTHALEELPSVDPLVDAMQIP